MRQMIGKHEKVKRLKFYELEDGSMIPISDIRFTRYMKPTFYQKEERWDLVLKSGPQFVISYQDFSQINEIIRYESEEVDRLTVFGKPIFESWIENPSYNKRSQGYTANEDWGRPLLSQNVRDEVMEKLTAFDFKPLPVESNKIGIDLVEDENIDPDKMIAVTDQKIKDMFASMMEDSSGKDSSSLDTYPKPKSYPQR